MRPKITVLALLFFVFITIISCPRNTAYAEAGKQGTKNLELQRTSDTEPDSSLYVPGKYYLESFIKGRPADWNVMNSDGGGNSWGSMLPGRTDTNCMFTNNETDRRSEDWLVTPQYKVFQNDSLIFYIRSASTEGGNDTLLVMESDSAHISTPDYGIAEAFTDTLLAIDMTKLYYESDSKWLRYGVSLRKYAGKKIYLAFKKSADCTGVVYLDDVIMGFTGEVDIQLTSIKADKYGAVGKSLTVRVGYNNKGTKTQSFDVVLDVPEFGYTAGKRYENIEPDDVGYAYIDWTPSQPGTFEIKAYPNMPGDYDSRNDIVNSVVTVFAKADSMKWFAETDLPEIRKYAASAYVLKDTLQNPRIDTGFVYLFGGDDFDGNMCNDVFKYNTETKIWQKSADPMHKSLHYFNAAHIGGKIYMAGGQSKLINHENGLTALEMQTGLFNELAPMPVNSYGYALGVYGDSLIYIMGGASDNAPENGYFTSSVQVYNIKTNEWKLATPFTGVPRMSIAGAICGNTIVVAGGFMNMSPDYSSAADIGFIDPKDPYTIKWVQSEYPSGNFSELSAGAWEGKYKKYIIFTGGYYKNYAAMKDSLCVKTWIYDVRQNTWLGGPDKISRVKSPSRMAVVTRNDSVFMAVTGGLHHVNYDKRTPTELLYIGKDEPYAFISKDIAAASIEIADTVYEGGEITPKAVFSNKQGAAQMYDAVMEITPGSYKSSVTVSSLNYQSVMQEVSFGKWAPDTVGTYTIKVYASVEGDNDSSNDTLISKVIVKGLVGTEDDNSVPAVYSLSQNYPNPFNPSTIIRYSAAEAGHVELKIFNMLGQEVKTLVNEYKPAGRYEIRFNAAGMNLSSGVYIYRIKAGAFVQTKKLMLVK